MKSKIHHCPSTYVSDWKVLLERISYVNAMSSPKHAPNVETRLVLPISWKLVNPLVHFSTGTTRKRYPHIIPHHNLCMSKNMIESTVLAPRSFHSNHRLIFHVINFWWFGSNNTVVSSHQNTQSDFPTLIVQHISKLLISPFHNAPGWETQFVAPSVDVWHIHAFPGLQLSATSDLHLWLPGEASTSTDNSRA